MAMYSAVLVVVVYLVAVQPSPGSGGVLHDGRVFQVYPDLEDVPNGTTPLYFALMQSFSGGYVSAGGIPGLMVALDEINRNSTVLPGYSLHYTLSDNAVGIIIARRRLFMLWCNVVTASVDCRAANELHCSNSASLQVVHSAMLVSLQEYTMSIQFTNSGVGTYRGCWELFPISLSSNLWLVMNSGLQGPISNYYQLISHGASPL